MVVILQSSTDPVAGIIISKPCIGFPTFSQRFTPGEITIPVYIFQFEQRFQTGAVDIRTAHAGMTITIVGIEFQHTRPAGSHAKIGVGSQVFRSMKKTWSLRYNSIVQLQVAVSGGCAITALAVFGELLPAGAHALRKQVNAGRR